MIVIAAGHTPEEPGATHEGFSEHPEAVEWAQEVHRHIDGYLPCLIAPVGPLAEKVDWINQQFGVWFAIEIHFNANASGRGQGSTTLYHPTSHNGARLADIVQRSLALTFPPDRGIKGGYFQGDQSKGVLYFLAHTSMPSIIIEPEFVYNARKIRESRDVACLRLAASLIEAKRKLYGT